MAFKPILHRASASIVPLSIRSVRTQAASGGVISSTLNVQNTKLIGSQFRPSIRFSTISVEDIVRLFESDHNGYKISEMIRIPDEYPFEIEDDGESVFLRGKYKDEKIVLEANGDEVTDDHRMVADIYGERQIISFSLTAKPDLVEIHSCNVRNRDQRMPAFEKYLEIRGFDNETIRFIVQLLLQKEKEV